MRLPRPNIWALAAMLTFAGCAHSYDDHEGHEADDHDHDATVVAAEHGHEEGDDEISLPAEQAARLGVEVETLSAGPLSDVIVVTGEVIPDPASRAVVTAPSSGSVALSGALKAGAKVGRGASLATVNSEGYAGGDANRSATLRLEAAKKELDRMSSLRADGIVTQQQYNAALDEYNQARNAVSTRGTSATAPIGGTVTEVLVANGQYVEAGTPIAAIASQGALRVRADIPRRLGERAARTTSARAMMPNSNVTLPLTAVTAPVDAAASAAYIPAWFALPGDAGLTPGSFVEVTLSADLGETGLTVPVSAITERMGTKFVYVQIDDDCYERRPVTLGASDGERVAVSAGLEEGERVVTQGTTFLRLAETSGAIPEGHHHH